MSQRRRILGVDYGTVRVGLAISDAERRIASPLAIVTRRDDRSDSNHFKHLVEHEEIGEIVVGLPVHLDGREGRKAGEARRFGQWLREVTQCPVIFWDERFTTLQAEQALWDAGLSHQRRQERRDKVAAQILLQAYLDAGCPGEVPIQGLDEE